jgi:hypothetical protein
MSVVVNQTTEVHEKIAKLLRALRLLNDAEPTAVEMGARVQMASLVRACQRAWEQGRFEKAADLAHEALALDVTAQTLSFFGRVYLKHVERALDLHHTGLFMKGGCGCPLHQTGDECKPADTNTCPAEPDPDLSLVWPVVVPTENGFSYKWVSVSTETPSEPPLPVTIPWCPPLPPIDFQVPLDLDRILEDAPLANDIKLDLKVEEIHEPEPFQSGVEIDLGMLETSVPVPQRTEKSLGSLWSSHCLDVNNRDGRWRLSLHLSLGGMVFEGRYVDGDISVKVHSEE